MNQTLTTLKQVIFEIFGDMFFMFPDQYEPDEEPVFPANWIKYRIQIKQKKILWLSCYFSPEQTVQMAENFLGASPEEISDVIVAETVKEAVNVFGGNLLNRLGDDYQLGIPEPCDAEDTAVLKEIYDRGDGILLNVEEFPFLATICIEDS